MRIALLAVLVPALPLAAQSPAPPSSIAEIMSLPSVGDPKEKVLELGDSQRRRQVWLKETVYRKTLRQNDTPELKLGPGRPGDSGQAIFDAEVISGEHLDCTVVSSALGEPVIFFAGCVLKRVSHRMQLRVDPTGEIGRGAAVC